MEELGAGYCPRGCKESGMTERLDFDFKHCLDLSLEKMRKAGKWPIIKRLEYSP